MVAFLYKHHVVLIVCKKQDGSSKTHNIKQLMTAVRHGPLMGVVYFFVFFCLTCFYLSAKSYKK